MGIRYNLLFIFLLIIAFYNNTIAQCDDFSIEIISFSDIPCHGQENGIINSLAINGTAPFEYVLFLDGYLEVGPQSNGNFNNLNGGNYTISVTDYNGCNIIIGQSLSEPNNPNLFISGLDPIYCISSNEVQLAGSPAGGFFLGDGVSGNTFTPQNVDIGETFIGYYWSDPNSSCIYNVFYSTTIEDFSVAELLIPTEFCATDTSTYQLQTNIGSGTFIYNNTPITEINPLNLGYGSHEIEYFFFDGICPNQQFFTINVTIPSIYINYFTDDLEATFTGPPNATSWQWTFPNGSTPATQTVNYQFDSYGIYSVCLVANFNNCELITCEVIQLSETDISAGFIYEETGLSLQFDNLSNGATDYLWDFGDGNTSTDENPINIYPDGGSYQVCLTAYNAIDTAYFCDFLYLDCFLPEPSFIFATNGLQINFGNTSNEDWLFEWDFGDGTVIPFFEPTYTFSSEGVYVVCLNATSECGLGQTCDTVTIVCPPPSIEIMYDSANYDYFFVANVQNGEDLFWNLGDGNTSTEAVFNHTYEYEGFYTVCVNTSNDCGTTSECVNLEVSCPIPIAVFNYTRIFTQVQFNFLGSDAETYLWDFGDGNTSTEQNPQHTYAAEDVYYTCLYVTSECGEDEFCYDVQVDCTPAVEFDYTFPQPLQVSLDNNSNAASSFEWTIDGALISTDINANFTFADDGIYEVCLSGFNDCGGATFCTFVEAECPAFENEFSYEQTGLTLSFEADTEIAALDLQWYLNNQYVSANPTYSAVFDSVGMVEMCLIAANLCDTVANCQLFEIECPPLSTSYNYEINAFTGIFNPEFVSFTEAHQWFVEGISQGSVIPLFYDFTENGDYEVCLEAYSICDTTSYCEIITVDCAIVNVEFEWEQTDGEGLVMANSTGDAGDYYTWFFEDNPGYYLSQYPMLNWDFYVPFAGDTTYTVCLAVANICGSDTLCQTLDLQSTGSFNFLDVNDVTCYNAADGFVQLEVISNGNSQIYDYDSLDVTDQQISFIDINDEEQVVSISITQPDSLGFNAVSINPTCAFTPTASIIINGFGGTEPYNYSLNNVFYSADNQFDNINAGYYLISITDTFDCMVEDSVQVFDQSAIVVEIDSINHAIDNNGYIELSISGGVEPYEVEWNTGEETLDIYDLSAGEYVLTILDANGCLFQETFVVSQGVGIGSIEPFISVYPNPMRDFIIVKNNNLPNLKYQILDLNGKIIIGGLITSRNQKINLNYLNRGSYIIKLTNNSLTHTEFIIKL